jgi:type IV pilus assembly protein PilB
MSEKPRVGEILVRAGVIDEMQLSSALGEQSRWGRRLGVTLIKMGMVEEGHLVRALAKQLDLPVASLAGKRISDDVIALVPMRVASEHGVIPLFVKKEDRTTHLFLGMEDPSNLAVLDDLSFRTGMEIHPVMVGPSELGEAMDRYYLGSTAGNAAHSDAERPGEVSGPGAGDAMGERNLRRVQDEKDEQTPPGLREAAQSTATSAGDSESENAELSPASRDTEIQLKEPAPALPDGLLEDVARAILETEHTRKVAKAIAQLLIEKGILTLEEVQDRIAQQKGGDAS